MKSSEGFLLRKVEYGEADYIISLFTKDFGKVSGLAKNAKRSRRRFGGRLEPFVHFRVRFREKPGGMKFIEDAETVRVFSKFMNDVELFTWGSFMLENVDILLPEEEPNGNIFDLLVHTFSALDTKKNPLLNEILNFQISLLSLSGYKPNFETCVECGKAIEEDGIFSVKKGGVFCKDCNRDKPNGSLIWKNLLPNQNLTELGLEAAFNHIRLLSKFTEYHTGKEIKSSKFLEGFKG